MFYKRLFVIFIVLVVGCQTSNKKTVNNPANPKNKVIQAKIKTKINIQQKLVRIASNKKKLFGLFRQSSNEYIVKKISIEKNTINSEKLFKIKRGKGPNEVTSFNNFEVSKNRMLIFDSVLNRISIFDFTGKLIDVININKNNIKSVANCVLISGRMIFNGFHKVKIGKFNYENGKYKIKKYQLKKTYGETYDGMITRGGNIYYDENSENVFLAYNNIPFKIEVYNKNLNLKKVIEKDINREVSQYRFKLLGKGRGTTAVGNKLITGIRTYKDFLYTVNQGRKSFIVKNNRLKPNLYLKKVKINIFDKKTGEYLYCIENEKLSDIDAIIGGIIDINKDHIILAYTETENEIFKKNRRKIEKGIVVLDNPLKKYE